LISAEDGTPERPFGAWRGRRTGLAGDSRHARFSKQALPVDGHGMLKLLMGSAVGRLFGKRSSKRGRRNPFRASIACPLALAVLAAGVCTPLISIKEAAAAELVIFESPACEWCEAWDENVGVIYHKTEEGRVAPLRRVALHAPRPADLEDVDAVIYTPTFVLMEDGREFGRITGYPGEDHFWGLLAEMLGKLQATTGSRKAGSPSITRSIEDS
jgi:hypothetical protein